MSLHFSMFRSLARLSISFTRILRFSIAFKTSNYGYFVRDASAMRLLEEPGRQRVLLRTLVRRSIFDVDDVEALFAELTHELDTLPDGEVQAPADQPWGEREFMVRMPDGNWLAFGQPLGKKA